MDWETASIWAALGLVVWSLFRIMDKLDAQHRVQKEINLRLISLHELIDEKDDGSFDRKVIKTDLGFINDKLHKLAKQFDKGR